jgi:hypothetical protein
VANCTAVGSYNISSSNSATLAEHWDGSTWVIRPTPATNDGTLSAVSCPSATTCTATGTHVIKVPQGSVYVTLAEHWDGSTWAIQSTPNPPSPVVASLLYGVSCTAAYTCTAAGIDVGAPGGFDTLAEVEG